MKEALVSIIIPTKNRIYCLERTIESVKRQSYAHTEIIVVDDGSEDGTSAFIRQKYPEVLLLRNESSRGGGIARNQGAAASSGQYLAFLDSDDEWLPHHLESGLSVLKKEQADGVFGSFSICLADNSRMQPKLNHWTPDIPILEYILGKVNGDARTSTFVLRRRAFMEVQFDERLLKHQDWDFAARFEQQCDWAFNQEVTAILHVDSRDRMSLSDHHPSTLLFIEKHYHKLTRPTQIRFLLKRVIRSIENGASTREILPYLDLGVEAAGPRPAALLFYLLKAGFPIKFAIKLFRKLRGTGGPLSGDEPVVEASREQKKFSEPL